MSRRSSKTRVSYVLRDDGDFDTLRHTAGVNALALDFSAINDASTAGEGGILYSGGRDALINSWSLNLDVARLRSAREARCVVSSKD